MQLLVVVVVGLVVSGSWIYATQRATKSVVAAIERHATAFAGFWGQDSSEATTQFIPWDVPLDGPDQEFELEFSDIVEGGE